MNSRVADVVADSLLAHGCDRLFSVPGESFLPLLDALVDRPALQLVTCRHEGSAALAAVADSKLTGRPGVAIVSRGPGLVNAAIGLHVASQDAVPLVVLLGQVETVHLGRNAVQEIDCRTLPGLLKWVGRIDSPNKAAEVVARAFLEAMSGTPGPVVVELPEDLLSAKADGIAARVHGLAVPHPSEEQVSSIAAALSKAERPVILAGGECRTDAFRRDLVTIAERWQIPVAVTNKQQDLFPNDHPCWIGQLGFFGTAQHRDYIEAADLVLAIGTRLGDVTTQGYSVSLGSGQQTLIHVYVDAGSIGRHYPTTIPVVSDAGVFAQRLATRSAQSVRRGEWLARAAHVRQATHGWRPDRIDSQDVLGHAITAAASRLPPNGILTCDSGNFAGWVHRIFRLHAGQRLISTACGAMGMGIPAAAAAAMRYPDRPVFAFCGDGGFLMNGSEFATVGARRLDVKVFVANNRSYGTIRSFQERSYPGRTSGTALDNPDFVALGRAYGAQAFSVDHASEAEQVVAEAIASPGPVLVEINCDVEFTLARSVTLQ